MQSTPPASSGVLMSPSSERCFSCFINSQRSSGGASVGYEGRSRGDDEKESLKRELCDIKAKLEATARERDRAMDENRAVQYQVCFVIMSF